MNGESLRTAVTVLLAVTLAVQAGFVPATTDHPTTPDDGDVDPVLAPTNATGTDGVYAPTSALEPGPASAFDADAAWGESVVPLPDPSLRGTVPSPTTLVEDVRGAVGVLSSVATPTAPPTLLVVAGRLAEDDDLLANDVRRSLYDAVRERPGRSLAAHATELDVSSSTVRYHVRVLERADGVRSERDRGRRRLYPTVDARDTDADADANDALAAALADEGAASVLRAVERLGPASVTTVAAATDRTVGTVSYHLDRLETDGLIERERRGRRVLVRLAAGTTADLDGGAGEG